MAVRIQISLSEKAEKSLVVQYIAVNPVQPLLGAANQRLTRTLKEIVQPGDSLLVELIHGYSSVSLHEGSPIVRLLPVPPTGKKPE